MYFYELHEGDDDTFSDLLLVHEELFDPDEFFDLVQAIRRRVQDTFEHDTLIEAVAEGLEDEHAFTVVSDDRLAASVRVSVIESENALTPIAGDERDEPEWGEDEDEFEPDDGPDYRGILVDLEAEPGSRPH